MATTFRIDPAHTDIAFSAKHMRVTTVRGKFTQVEGELTIDDQDPTASRGEVRAATASVESGFKQRDDHLRSADFFDAETHPWIVFRATAIEAAGDDRFRVSGDVEIRGVSRPVTFDVRYLGGQTGLSGNPRIAFSGRAKVNRKDWGLNWNVALEAGGWLVGDEISLDIDISAEAASPAERAPETTERELVRAA